MLFLSAQNSHYWPESPGNSPISETGSLETASSSGESGTNCTATRHLRVEGRMRLSGPAHGGASGAAPKATTPDNVPI